MALTTMYAAQTNSPTTTLASAAGAADTSLIVTSAAVLPSTTPFELSLGIGEAAAETVLVTAVNGNTLTVTRGWDGTPQAWAVNTVCARTFSARDLNDMQSNISALSAELGALVDTTLTEQGKAADAYTTGRAIYRTKDRSENTAPCLTYWDFTVSHNDGFTPADMPINSYCEAQGGKLSNFGSFDYGTNTYLVWCWANMHSTVIRNYLVMGRANKMFIFGRSTNSGSSVTWTNWTQQIDADLTTSGAAADAAAVGTAIYRTKNRTANYPAAFTWWEISETYSAENPAGPTNMPVNSYTFAAGSWLTGFNNSVFSLSNARYYFVFCWASLHNAQTRFYQIIGPNYNSLFVGRSMDGGSTVTWSNWSPPAQKTPSIMFFGDSIVRGSTGSSQSANRIPDIAGAELGVRCENFGIGNIGWLNTGGTNKTNAIGYLQRVGDDTFYDPSDGWNGYKFLGKGNWSDFNAIVISLGINDGGYPLGSIDTDIVTAGLDAMSYADIMALTPTKIVTAMYQCYRYVRNISSTINIIISDPLISKGNSGVPPLWSYNANIGSGGWSRMDLCELNAAFCQRYGLGHITNFDAPIDRVDITNSLADNVHPKSATYAALGLHFAGKIGALIL